MKTFSAIWSDAVGAAIKKAAPDFYQMDLARPDAETMIKVVNQGIDSHLEACFVPDRGDKYDVHGCRMTCKVSRESLPVLVRRLMESDDENAQSLASGICETIGIELI